MNGNVDVNGDVDFVIPDERLDSLTEVPACSNAGAPGASGSEIASLAGAPLLPSACAPSDRGEPVAAAGSPAPVRPDDEDEARGRRLARALDRDSTIDLAEHLAFVLTDLARIRGLQFQGQAA